MLSTKRLLCCAASAVLGLSAFSASASAQVFLSEIFVNPPGTDNGSEAIELTGTPGQSLDGWFIIIIEGDGTGAGTVDQVLSLSGQTIGTNGLLLLRDAASPLVPNPDPATPILVMDFNPDIENGTNTYLLGFGTPPALNSDLDAGNDGTIDAPLAGFTVVDAVSMQENDNTPADNDQYADDFGGTNILANPGFNADVLYRVLDASHLPLGWAGGDVLGALPGPFNFDGARFFGWDAFGVPDPSVLTLDPGIINFVVVGPAIGACCMADGTCTVGTAAECAGLGGSYQGDNSSCETANCPQPAGACCFADGTCQSLTAVACLDAGGTFGGNFTSCGNVTCNVAVPSACFLSELFINVPGTDQGGESIEITGPAGASLDGWWIIVIEGDLGVSGAVDAKISLNGCTTGANGVCLIRDTTDLLLPAPDASTNVFIREFTPDLENGSNTYILGYGIYPVAIGADLDANDDGTLDGPLPASFTPVEVVSYIDGDNDGVEYGDEFPGGAALGRNFDILLEPYTPDALYRVLDASHHPLAWVGGDVLGTTPGPFNWDPIQSFGFAAFGIADPSTLALDLGTLNFLFAAPPSCPCDWNHDLTLNSQDFFDFIAAFFGGGADYNMDSQTNSQDFFDFLSCFFNPPSGC